MKLEDFGPAFGRLQRHRVDLERHGAPHQRQHGDDLAILLEVVYLWFRALNEQPSTSRTILEEIRKMAGELADLTAKVHANTTVIQSAITLLQGLKQKLDDAIASGDPAALTALSTELGATDQALADAITANTPSAPGGGGTTPPSP